MLEFIAQGPRAAGLALTGTWGPRPSRRVLEGGLHASSLDVYHKRRSNDQDREPQGGSQMSYRMIVLDIDGTIRSLERPISAKTRSAVEGVKQKGALVTVATGRTFRSAQESIADLNITSPIASYQGAHVADPASGKVLWHRPLTPDMALAALNALATWKGEVLAYHGGQVYVNTLTPWVEGYRQRIPDQVHVVADLTEWAAKGPTRLVAVGGEKDVQRLGIHLSTAFDSRLYVTRSLPHFCEILHPDSGKHQALKWLCHHLGIRPDETIAFGNSYDDVLMLQRAGLGVALSGSPSEVLEAADAVAPPVDEDGVAQVLEDLMERGLIG